MIPRTPLYKFQVFNTLTLTDSLTTYPELVLCVCVLLCPGNLGQTLVPLLLLPVDQAEGSRLLQQVDAALKTEIKSESRITRVSIPHH